MAFGFIKLIEGVSVFFFPKEYNSCKLQALQTASSPDLKRKLKESYANEMSFASMNL